MKKFNDLKNFVLELEVEADKFYNRGFDIAGTRLRLGMLILKKKLLEVREDVLMKRKIRKKEKRSKTNY